MVTFITGPINSGKTTYMKDLYDKTKAGDGFISLKIISENQVEGFDVLHLSSGEKRPLIRVVGNEYPGWVENCRIGKYTFSDEAVNWVSGHIESFIKDGVFPIFLDEVGDLEIDGKCFYRSLNILVESGLDLYLSMRDKNLYNVMDSFGITDVKTIKMGERYA